MTSDSNASFLERVYYYDGRGRCVQCKELYPGGSWHRVSTKYAYTSEVTMLADDCYVNGIILTSTFTYTYDSRGRKTSLDVSHGGKTARISYNYDNLGRLESTVLGGSSTVATVTDSYTVQGWLKQRTSSQFSSFLYYDAPLHASVASAPGLAGNITEWRTVRGSQTSSLAFSYDKMSRLSGASRFNGTSNVSLAVNTEQDITYDANGNITTLKRYGAAGSSPQQLSFSYDGNKRIADSYDQYGNLTADGTAGTSLAWSIAGMPRTITTGSTVGRYSFAADGTKYKLSDGSTELIYMGSMVIRKQNNVTSLDILNFGDGVIRRNGSALEVNYYIKDHLGSIRTVLNDSGTILSQHDYYPFGKEITASGSSAASQRYTFSGKENQATTPAQAPYLDFGARMYSADSLRWLSHDPLAEKYYSVTPYSYCAGNPVNLVDPDGEEPSMWEALLMAARAYQDNDKSEYEDILNKYNWEVDKSFNTLSGVNAVLFRRESNGCVEYTFAFAGTEPGKDYLSDVSQLIGLSVQYEVAIILAKNVSSSVGQSELTFVGHSLGGGEATAASLATGRSAITFNPAELSRCTKFNHIFDFGMPGNITNYIAITDRGLPDFVTLAQLSFRMKYIGSFMPISVGNVSSWEAHKIRTLYNAVKK